MIDPVTRWFKLVQYNDKKSATTSIIIKKSWICRYPTPKIIACNRGNSFLGHSFKAYFIQNKYKVKPKCESTTRPQAKYVLERIYALIADLVCRFDFKIFTETRMTLEQVY